MNNVWTRTKHNVWCSCSAKSSNPNLNEGSGSAKSSNLNLNEGSGSAFWQTQTSGSNQTFWSKGGSIFYIVGTHNTVTYENKKTKNTCKWTNTYVFVLKKEKNNLKNVHTKFEHSYMCFESNICTFGMKTKKKEDLYLMNEHMQWKKKKKTCKRKNNLHKNMYMSIHTHISNIKYVSCSYTFGMKTKKKLVNEQPQMYSFLKKKKKTT